MENLVMIITLFLIDVGLLFAAWSYLFRPELMRKLSKKIYNKPPLIGGNLRWLEIIVGGGLFIFATLWTISLVAAIVSWLVP